MVIVVSPSSKTSVFKPVQPLNVLLDVEYEFVPIRVTEAGIVSDSREEQPENTLLPMEVNVDGSFTDVKPVQPANVKALSVVILVQFDKSNEVKEEQL